MSACNILFQKNKRAVHMAVDGASYDVNGVIQHIGQKSYSLPTLHAAISMLGIGMGGLLMPIELAMRFSSFDDMIGGIEAAAPQIYSKILLSNAPVKDATLYIIGWSKREDGPASYILKMNETSRDEAIAKRDEKHKNEFGECAFVGCDSFKLERADFSTITPPAVEPLFKLGFPKYDMNLDIGDQVENVELDFLHMLEAQRRRKFQTIEGCDETPKVGGLALLTTITEEGIFQKVMHRWDEDRVGQPIVPRPIDWTAWRSEQAGINLSGLSRLRRERMLKKIRKGTLKA